MSLGVSNSSWKLLETLICAKMLILIGLCLIKVCLDFTGSSRKKKLYAQHRHIITVKVDMETVLVGYLNIQQILSNINIHWELCFSPPSEYKFNIHSVLVLFLASPTS